MANLTKRRALFLMQNLEVTTSDEYDAALGRHLGTVIKGVIPMRRDRGSGTGNSTSLQPTLRQIRKFIGRDVGDTEPADRVQVIKGWIEKSGKASEKIYDVVWSGDRRIGRDGKLSPVGNTVDIKNASYTNTIGAAQLKTSWTDPTFDPSLPAFYYVRVLEIPTPRWSTYDAKTLGIEPPKGFPATIQERAWSSPIWYRP